MLFIDLDYKKKITALVYEQFLKEEKKRNQPLHTNEEKILVNAGVGEFLKWNCVINFHLVYITTPKVNISLS